MKTFTDQKTEGCLSSARSLLQHCQFPGKTSRDNSMDILNFPWYLNICVYPPTPPDGATARGGPWPPLGFRNNYFSILCLTTDVSIKVMRKKSVTSARSPRNTSAQPGDLYGMTSRWLYGNTSAQPGDRYGVTSRWLYEKTNLASSNMLRA